MLTVVNIYWSMAKGLYGTERLSVLLVWRLINSEQKIGMCVEKFVIANYPTTFNYCISRVPVVTPLLEYFDGLSASVKIQNG